MMLEKPHQHRLIVEVMHVQVENSSIKAPEPVIHRTFVTDGSLHSIRHSFAGERRPVTIVFELEIEMRSTFTASNDPLICVLQ